VVKIEHNPTKWLAVEDVKIIEFDAKLNLLNLDVKCAYTNWLDKFSHLQVHAFTICLFIYQVALTTNCLPRFLIKLLLV